MFSTTWCPACSKARAFLSANGLSWVERDIDADRTAHDELERRTGATSIPVLEVDGALLSAGLNQAAVMKAVAKSVEQRLGITGIGVRGL